MAEVLRQITRIDIPTTLVGGACLIGSYEARKQDFWYKNVTKNVRRFDDAVLPIAVGIVGIIIRQPVLQKMLVLGFMVAIKDAYLEYYAKEPWVRANSETELEMWNFDASSVVHVVIDGSEVTFSTAPTTDANGYAKVTLPSAMAAGLHRVVVWTEGGKAWAGFVVV